MVTIFYTIYTIYSYKMAPDVEIKKPDTVMNRDQVLYLKKWF